jgi:hypothetical protein
MFKKSKIAAAIALTMSATIKADLTTDLVAYYPFTGNANDASGNGNNGTVYGATLTADRNGNANSAYSFNGSSDYIDINLPTINTTTGAKVTVNFWMNWDGVDDVMPFGFNLYEIYLVTGYFAFNTNNNDRWGISSSGLANHWVYVTAIFNNGDATLSSLYLDGSNRTLAQLGNSSVVRNVSTNARISGRPNDSRYRFGGKIDDVRIYNRALTDTEVQQLYQANLTIPTTTTLISSANPASLNQNVIFTANVTATSIPTGNLTFKVDGTAKQTSALNSGLANYATNTLTTGAHTIRAEYAGNTSFAPSAAQLTQTVVGKPDFVVTAATLTPTQPTSGNTFTAAVTVKNSGGAGDGGQLRLWLNQPTAQTCAATGGDKNLAVGTLAAGASKILTFTGLNPGLSGAKILRAFVDAACAVSEANDSNNQFVKGYMVKDLRADFVVTALTVTPASPVANNLFTLSATVKNQGAAARPAGYLDVWMNQPTATACGANSDAWLDIGTIAAGASKTVTLSLVAETSGAKTARAFVDSWCETIEANEGNNQRTLSYTVQ